MGKPWFRVKQYGVGAGLPCSWEGWAVTAFFVLAIISVNFLPVSLTDFHPWLPPALKMGLFAGIIAIIWLKSDKPWRWRWGGK